MAVNCYVTLNSTVFYPSLPVARRQLIIAERRRMLNGQLRTAYRATKYEFTLTLPDASEAERTAWIAAAVVNASVTYVDELGVSRTVVVTDVTEPLVRTVPSVEGGTSTTGPGYYDLSVVIEEV